MQPGEPPGPSLDDDRLRELEAVARDLAAAAGREIVNALARGIHVEYKSEPRTAGDAPTDPVSEVDHAVEALIRSRLRERFPGHAVIGEEADEHPSAADEFAWAVDPVDGTTNFVNRFPLFAASIGVLYRGQPVAGAIWCSTSHALDRGVYHARLGGALSFDGAPVETAPANTGVRRALAAAPGGAPGRTAAWDNRVTGSAALECAFVAAGIFTSARFWSPHIWDVAAGIVLLRAAGRDALVASRSGWTPFERFEPPSRLREDREPTLRDWVRPMLIGSPEALEALRRRPAFPWWRRLLRL
ncbi:MAG: hypothetical protein Kow0010_15510 [Dehalococcoidia bacterium]